MTDLKNMGMKRGIRNMGEKHYWKLRKYIHNNSNLRKYQRLKFKYWPNSIFKLLNV